MRNVGFTILSIGLLAISISARAEFASRYSRMLEIEEKKCFVSPQPATDRLLIDCQGHVYLSDPDGIVTIDKTDYRIVFEEGTYHVVEAEAEAGVST